MKKIFKNLIFVVLLLFQFAYAAYDLEQIKKERSDCQKLATSSCFLRLYNKYSTIPNSWRNVLYCDYASALMAEKDYAKAKEAFNTVLFRETTNIEIINYAKKNIENIDEMNKKISDANRNDSGNYADKIEEKILWKYPNNIKVYIASNTGKESIFKKAFGIWDDKAYRKVNFTYVKTEKEADITIKFVNSISDTVAGITRYPSIIVEDGKKYLNKVVIDVALKKASGGNYTDTNLLAISLHEIGHGLGIKCHSENLNDIMYYSTETYKNNNISRRDINTILMLYK